jgi:hypothetical protein
VRDHAIRLLLFRQYAHIEKNMELRMRWNRFASVAFALGMALFSSSLGSAQTWLSEPGSVGTDTAKVGVASLKLPPGQWQKVSEITDIPQQFGGESLRIHREWLAQISGSQIASLIFVSSNITHSTKGWRADVQCNRRNVVFYSNDSENDRNYDCLMVNHRVIELGDNPSEFWISTLKRLDQLGKYPHQMICSNFAMASGTRLDFINVAVCVNPTLAGFPDPAGQTWARSDWNKIRITPDRQAYIDKVAAWARKYHDTVANSF